MVPLIWPLTITTLLRSEKIRSVNKGGGVNVVLSIPKNDSEAPSIRLTDPKALRRATLKIGFYLSSIFLRVPPLLSPFTYLSSPSL